MGNGKIYEELIESDFSRVAPAPQKRDSFTTTFKARTDP